MYFNESPVNHAQTCDSLGVYKYANGDRKKEIKKERKKRQESKQKQDGEEDKDGLKG